MKVKLAAELGCSAFEKSIKSPLDTKIIKPIATNKKMSGNGKYKLIQKGKYKGLPFYKISLEERKTCPRSCKVWDKCYGNHMPFAYRINHQHPQFYQKLQAEIALLDSINPLGFVVRLHELGDFFSVEYAEAWIHWMDQFKGLNLIGFTAHQRYSEIGDAVHRMNKDTYRCYIRWSGLEDDMGAVISEDRTLNGFRCPAQLSKEMNCSNCTLCWDSRRLVVFKSH